jgi:hypothetical protein
MQGHGAKMPRKQEQAIVALIAAETVEKAAQQINVAPSTLYRWLHEDEFRAAYREAKTACVSQAIGRLQQASAEAVETLRTIMRDQTKPASTRVQAARIILETSLKAVEVEEIQDRINRLEEIVQKRELL